MFALGLLSNLTKATGPTKDEVKAEAGRKQQLDEDRDANEKATDDKRKEREGEEGADKENKENKESNKPLGEEEELMTKQEFVELEKRRNVFLTDREKNEEVLDGHRNYVARRWMVRIWNMQLESIIKDECMIFLNLNWGGDRKECRVKTGEGEAWWDLMSDKEVVWGIGTDPLCLRSDVMELEEKGSITFRNEFSFEWRGSYSDLQTQSLEIELWRFNKIRANTLDSVHKTTLDTYASGPVFQEVALTKSMKQDDEQQGKADAPTRFKATFQLYFQELYDFELNVIDVQIAGLLSVDQLRRMTAQDFSRTTKYVDSKKSDDTLPSIHDPSDGEDTDEDITAVKAPVLRRRGTVSMVPVVKKIPTKTALKAKRKVVLKIENRGFTENLRRGQMSVTSGLKRSEFNLDRWGNIGKIHYRGTLADLDNDLLRLTFFESSLVVPAISIGEATVSLRGVHEFGNISGSCRPPPWVLSKSMSSEETKQILKASIGRFEAKLTVENLPKYKQSGELCDMITDKAYLLVKVLRVDRVAIPDQRPINQCDSAVQVQFSGTSYETEVRQDTIAPQFDQEFYFELKTDSPSEFTPEELAMMHGPIIFDVWLRSDDEGALSAEHCGHVEISLEEIFADGKPEFKLHNSIRTGELTEYRTQVLKARKRVTCLWTDGRPGAAMVNVPATALAPSYLYVDIWLRPFDFMAFNIQSKEAKVESKKIEVVKTAGLLPAAVRLEWSLRAKQWDSLVRELNARIPLTRGGFNYTAQSQNRDEHFLPLFLDVIRPPELLSNPRAIAFWIHCLSHTSMTDLKAAVGFWSTPDFTLSLGKGDTFAHAILHASMLRGLAGNIKPFVCVGTGWDGAPVAWVMLMQPTGSVTMYDTASHRSFELPNRCADTDRAWRVVAKKRLPGQQLAGDLQALEVRRRERLSKQEVSMRKLGVRAEPSAFGCDPAIFRAPELLKLFEPAIHEHALVYSTNIARDGQCYRCGLPPEQKALCGFVCNQKLLVGKSNYTSTEGALCLADDSGAYLCMRCAKYPDEAALVKDANGNYTLKNILQPLKFSTQPTLPYKTIEIIFDHTNVWLNRQHFCPCAILYDLWNPLYWHPFTSVSTTFRSFSMASKGLRKAKSKEYLTQIKLRIVAKVKKTIQALRRNGNLSTHCQREELLIEHMELGLELQFRLELVDQSLFSAERSSLEAELNEWKLQLYAKIPRQHRFIGHTFQFSFYDSIEISRIVCEQINLNALKEIGTQFVVTSYLGKLPNSVTACYVSVGIVHPLNEQIERDDLSPFADEIVEHNRLFTLRSSIFETDMEFISAMRNDLYKDREKGGIVTVKTLGPGSKAPVSANEFVKSIVDYNSLGVLHELDEEAQEEEEEEELEEALPGVYDDIASDVAAIQQGVGSYFDSFLTSVPSDEPVSMKPPRAVKPPKDFTQKYPVFTPVSKANALNPTPAELELIYQPQRFDNVTGQRQYLRNTVTGATVPLPPQSPLLHAVSLGADNLVGTVHVKTGTTKRNITTVKPTKEAFIKFNSRINDMH